MEKAIVNKFFLYQRKKSNNKKCIDCNTPSTIWVNLTYSIFICTACAGKHRSLGVNVCTVKSTIHDQWTLNELKRIFVGGNMNIRKYVDFDKKLEERLLESNYKKILDELVMEVSDEVLFDLGTQEIDTKVFENVVIEEKAVPKIGVVTNESYFEDINVNEESVECKSKIMQKNRTSEKYKIKTNAFKFTKTDAPFKSMEDGIKKEDENAEIYSYENMKGGFSSKRYEEKSGVKENVSKVLDKTKKTTKEFLEKIIRRVRK